MSKASEFCESALSSNSFAIGFRSHAAVLLFVLGLLYGLASVCTLYWIWLQARAAKSGNTGAARNVIFPVFVYCMYLSCFTDLLVGVAVVVSSFNPNSLNSVVGGVSYSFSWALQHVVIEGVAFLLMQYGCGFKAARIAFVRSIMWGCITFALLCSSIFAKNIIARVLTSMSWSLLLLLFYATLWLAKTETVFRRPAAVFYARFWTLFRICVLVSNTLGMFSSTRPAGNCTYVFGALFGFSVAKPVIIYWTLIKDSEWWQGLGTDSDDPGNQLKSPLLGMDLSLFNAQQLADSIDRLQMSVRRLNFAYIQLDKRNVLGEGSSSRVYRAQYKSRPCAVKMLFTLDLTREVIHRCCTEATILSSIHHPNVVNIWGVSVLPPSVCLVLELCPYGSLSDVLRGKLQADGKYGAEPPLRLCWTDKLHLALGCARGLAALHQLDGGLCHRDVKSFNFLVDGQLNTKIADLELGVEEDVCDSSPCVSPSTTRHIWRMSFGSGLDVSENALANWLAPEVLRGASHTQSSDVYSLGLVLYEIVTGQLPFAECKNQAAVRAANASGKKPVIPAHIPEEYVSIIKACWNPNPTQRPTAAQVAEDLFNLWLQSVHRVVKYVEHQLEPEASPHVFHSNAPPSPSMFKRLQRAFSYPKEHEHRSTADYLSMSTRFGAQWMMLEEDKRPFVVISGGETKWIVHCTRSFTQMTHFLPYDILGREFDVFTGPSTDMSVVHDFLLALQHLQHGHAVLNLYRKVGVQFLASIHAYPVYPNTEDSKAMVLEAMFDPAIESLRSSASSQLSSTSNLTTPRATDSLRLHPRYFVLLFNVLQDHLGMEA